MDPEIRSGLNSGSSVSGRTRWHFFGKKLPKMEIVFFAQVLLIYIVALFSIVNLTLGKDGGKIWTALLGSSLGYLLPSPSLKKPKL